MGQSGFVSLFGGAYAGGVSAEGGRYHRFSRYLIVLDCITLSTFILIIFFHKASFTENQCVMERCAVRKAIDLTNTRHILVKCVNEMSVPYRIKMMKIRVDDENCVRLNVLSDVLFVRSFVRKYILEETRGRLSLSEGVKAILNFHQTGSKYTLFIRNLLMRPLLNGSRQFTKSSPQLFL